MFRYREIDLRERTVTQKILPSLEGIFEVGPSGEPQLFGLRCASCGFVVFPPPVPSCPRCFSEELNRTALSTSGIIHSITEVHTAPVGFTPPYVLAYVDLPEGVRLLGQVDRADGIAPGSRVEMIVGTIKADPDGTERIGYRFQRSG